MKCLSILESNYTFSIAVGGAVISLGVLRLVVIPAASDGVCGSVNEVGWNAEIGNFGARDLRSAVYMMGL